MQMLMPNMDFHASSIDFDQPPKSEICFHLAMLLSRPCRPRANPLTTNPNMQLSLSLSLPLLHCVQSHQYLSASLMHKSFDAPTSFIFCLTAFRDFPAIVLYCSIPVYSTPHQYATQSWREQERGDD